MRILSYYILRLHLVPFILGFGVITFILEMDALFDYLDLIVNRGVAVGVVGQMFLLSLGFIVALSLPCAVLVAVLMTFGRLSQDNEITALRASGVNMAHVLLLPLAASAAIAWGLTLFNNHVLPETNHLFANLLMDIGRMRPTVKLQEGVFITDLPGYNLLVRSVNGRTNEMRGVTIYRFNPGGSPTTIMAKRGFLSYSGQNAVLQLEDGEIHEVPHDDPENSSRYRRVAFKKQTIYVANAGGMLERSVREMRSDREMDAGSLIKERNRIQHEFAQSVSVHRIRLTAMGLPAAELQRALGARLGPPGFADAIRVMFHREDPLNRLGRRHPQLGTELELLRMEKKELRKRIAGLSVEIHKKFSLPVACIVFVLIGAPLGMRVRRAGPAVAFISVAFFLFYYLCLVGGEELANRLLLPPWFAMWLPNLVLGGWGIHSTLRACELLPLRPQRARAGATAS